MLQGCSRTREQSHTKLCVLARHAEEAGLFMLRAVNLDGVLVSFQKQNLGVSTPKVYLLGQRESRQQLAAGSQSRTDRSIRNLPCFSCTWRSPDHGIPRETRMQCRRGRSQQVMGSALKRIGCLQVTLTLRQPTIFNNIRLKGPGIDCSAADGDIVNIYASPLRRTRSRFQPHIPLFATIRSRQTHTAPSISVQQSPAQELSSRTSPFEGKFGKRCIISFSFVLFQFFGTDDSYWLGATLPASYYQVLRI